MFPVVSTSHRSARILGFGVFACFLCSAGVAFADAGATELFIQNTTSILRTLHGSLSGTAVSNGYTDKELHFGVSVLMGAIGYPLMVILFQHRVHGWLLMLGGLFAGLVPGIAKELIDMSNPPDYFSWADVAYDATGVMTGIIIGWILLQVCARVPLSPSLEFKNR